MKVLIIKMTSMGDIIHLFPALTDAKNHYKNISFDWVIDESFQELALWHNTVEKVIPIALRRWRKTPASLKKEPTITTAFKNLRQTEYDLIIDAQGLFKSALVSLFAKGPVAGLDWHSAREKTASLFYQKKYSVLFQQHAVRRGRELFAKVLGYPIPDDGPDYGLKFTPSANIDKEFLVFFHGTTWANKHWPEQYWRELVTMATEQGFTVCLPWGNAQEKQRAETLAQGHSLANVLPKMSLTELAQLLTDAKGVVAVDTGLAHLSSALAKPTVSMYGPTDPKFTGTLGDKQIHLAADFSCAPCLRRSCNYPSNETTLEPACFTTLPPEYVWQEFKKLITQE